MYKKILVGLLVMLPLSFALSGCETVKGAGKDIEKAGEEIQEASD
ncbi:hypothetical protein TDB9533_02521 [Thalassocella blandensis]|nr:hypothetical protein TDB9533_02521 [Thalassocella blandensis]